MEALYHLHNAVSLSENRVTFKNAVSKLFKRESGSLLSSPASFIEKSWQKVLIGVLLAVDTQIADGILTRFFGLVIDLLGSGRVLSVFRAGPDGLLELEVQPLRQLGERQRLDEQLLHV